MAVTELTEGPADTPAAVPGGPGALPDVPLDVVAALAHAGEPTVVHQLPAAGVETRVAYANPAFLRLSGYAPGEVLGAAASVCWGDAADRPALDRAFAALRRGEAVDVPLPLCHKDGTRDRGTWSLTPVGAPPSGPRHFASAFHDATAEQRRSLALAERAAVGEVLFANHLDAVYELDLTGRVLRVNAATERLVGCPRERIVGRPVSDFIPDDEMAVVMGLFARAVQGEATAAQHWVLRCDGSRRCVRVTKTPVVVNGLVVGVYGVCQDVTERLAAERQLREREGLYSLLVEQSPECVCVFQDERCAYINRAGARMRGPGLEPADVESRHWAAYVHPDDRDRVEAEYRSLLAGPVGATVPIEHRFLWPDGRVVEVEGVATAVVYGGRAAVHSFARDVTARRRADAERLRAQRFEALGRLAAGVAHDFNNLLAVMLGAVEMAEQALPADEASLRADLAAAADAARRGRALTRQLLTFARRQESQPQRVDVNALVRGMAELLRRIVGPRVRLELALAPEAGAVVADPAQAEQVLLNLVTNARDAVPDGGEVRVETARENGDLRLTVRDTGVGIPPEVRPHLFEPFFSTKTDGHGLGLATVYGVVTGAGGRVDVESEPGRGAAFHLRLPRAAEGAAAEGAGAEGAGAAR